MVTSCINNIQHFNNQLTHTLKNVELLKHFKISKTAPTNSVFFKFFKFLNIQ